MHDFSTVIIGGGISGLTCAKYLNEKGYNFMSNILHNVVIYNEELTEIIIEQ